MPGSSPPPVHHTRQLERQLGFLSALGIVIGVTIGSGIFRTPAVVAERVPSPALMLGIWVIGGLISLAGALSVAELAASHPHTGGWYVYLREGWGRLAGFLFGWAELVLIRASATGAMATVFSEYLLGSFGYDAAARDRTGDLVAAAAIVGTAAINIRGTRLGALFVGVSTAAKFGALVVMVGACVLLGGGAGGSISNFAAPATAPLDASRVGLALISVLWAYDGLADISFSAGEVRDPQRVLPRAILTGTLAVTGIYLAANAAYLYLNPLASLAASPLIAADTMEALFGRIGVTAVSLVVAISTFGALMATMLAAPRVFFAMADDGLFFRPVARVHPRYGTPHVAILLSAGLGVFFVLTRTFEQLTDTFVLTIWPFYGLAIAGLYRIRRREPDRPRPFSVPGYPFVPAAFIAAVLYLVLSALASDPVWTAVTLSIVLAGVPVYYLSFRNSATSASPASRE
jgi:amino acid transporter